MRVVGGAIGPDEVLVWSGERELTRFHRGGTRSSFTVPVSAVASRVGDALWIVDARGTIHRYDLAGRRVSAVALRSPPLEGIVSASLSGDGTRLAAIVGDEMTVYEAGDAIEWHSERSMAMHSEYRERRVELSHDGNWALVEYRTSYGWTEHGSTGSRGDGVAVTGRDTARFDDYDARHSDERVHALSLDGTWLATATNDIFDSQGQPIYTNELTVTHLLDGRVLRPDAYGHTRHVGFSPRYFAALFDAHIVLVDLATGFDASLELPERGFRALVVTDEDVVAIHDELGAWWIPVRSF